MYDVKFATFYHSEKLYTVETQISAFFLVEMKYRKATFGLFGMLFTCCVNIFTGRCCVKLICDVCTLKYCQTLVTVLVNF